MYVKLIEEISPASYHEQRSTETHVWNHKNSLFSTQNFSHHSQANLERTSGLRNAFVIHFFSLSDIFQSLGLLLPLFPTPAPPAHGTTAWLSSGLLAWRHYSAKVGQHNSAVREKKFNILKNKSLLLIVYIRGKSKSYCCKKIQSPSWFHFNVFDT